MAFSQNLYNLLQRVEERLQTSVSYSAPLKTQAIRELLDWCAEHELPTSHWVTGNQAIFDHAVLVLINETLRQLGQPAIEQAISGLSRYEQGQLGSREEKTTSRPKEGRVLVLQPDASEVQLSVLLQSAADLILDVAVEQLDLERPASLLVVENLDMFYRCLELHRLGEQRLPESCVNSLIVYRGHQHDARAVRELVRYFIEQGRPACYLGDFDPAGLNIALEHGYSHILLPELQLLQRTDYTERYSSGQQADFERLLRRSCDWPAGYALQPYTHIMLQQQRSLRHQRYRGRLECLPLPQPTHIEVDHV